MIVLELPEPPSLNQMLDWRGAGWQVYYGQQQRYARLVRALLPEDERPAQPWERWAINRAVFRLWNPRDRLELYAGLKWAVDVLVEDGWVVDDGPRNLVRVAEPEQTIARMLRGATLWIEETDDE